MGDTILTMNDIDKSFPGVHALDHVHFDVKRRKEGRGTRPHGREWCW